MKAIVVGASLFVAAGACAVTPDLDYADIDADGPPSLGGFSADAAATGAGRPGDAAGDSAGNVTHDAAGSSSGGGSSGGTSSGGADSAPPPPPPPPPPADSGAGSTPKCPLIVAIGVQCCTTPQGSRTCVGDACTHCDDCFKEGCTATQYCCSKAKGGGKGNVSCSASAFCLP